MGYSVEYAVADIIERKPDRCFVSGRILSGTLQVGQVLTVIETSILIDKKTFIVERVNKRQISLRIVRMEWMVRLEVYTAGDTPGLHLMGEGLEEVKERTILSAIGAPNLPSHWPKQHGDEP